MTEPEYGVVKRLSVCYADDEMVEKARRIVAEDFRNKNAVGVLRVREHTLFPAGVDAETTLDRFVSILAEFFPGSGE